MRKQLKQQEQSQSAIALEIAPAGIEPTSKVPETFVLSIERRSRDGAHYDMSQCGCQACNPSQQGRRIRNRLDTGIMLYIDH